MRMPYAFLSVLVILTFFCPHTVLAQSPINVNIVLASPTPSCTVDSGLQDLSFGTVQKPTSVSDAGSVTCGVVSGSCNVVTNIPAPVGASLGSFSVTGQHANTARVTMSSLSIDGLAPDGAPPSVDGLNWAGEWGHSTGTAGTFTVISGTSHGVTVGGAGNSVQTFFRLGGTMSDIELADPDGTYQGEISVTASCE